MKIKLHFLFSIFVSQSNFFFAKKLLDFNRYFKKLQQFNCILKKSEHHFTRRMSWESFVDSDIMNSDYGAETCSSGYITPQLGSEQEYNINSILKNREQKVEIKTNHRRAQSLNSLLPQEIVSIFDGDQKLN